MALPPIQVYSIRPGHNNSVMEDKVVLWLFLLHTAQILSCLFFYYFDYSCWFLYLYCMKLSLILKKETAVTRKQPQKSQPKSIILGSKQTVNKTHL